jgi:hypothetical protein
MAVTSGMLQHLPYRQLPHVFEPIHAQMQFLVQRRKGLGVGIPIADVEVRAGSVTSLIDEDLGDMVEHFEGKGGKSL